MNRKTVAIAAGLVFFFVLGFAVARMVSGTGIIPRDVVAGGGGRSTAPSGHILNSTIGQPIAGLSTAGNGTILVGGFQTMVPQVSTSAQRWSLY
ncbi:MAG: hypothetical protein N3D11_13925 [Candidatus Sumerlaeia bacterium]|nr:hypothetical protein [Candidatus Sumerlaeia bacterium]